MHNACNKFLSRFYENCINLEGDVMKRVVVKELRVNNKRIVFKENENYIIGPNASGKTTLFT